MEGVSNNNTPEQTFTHPRFPINSSPDLPDLGLSSLWPELRHQHYHLLPVIPSPQMMQADLMLDNPFWIPDPTGVPRFTPNVPPPMPVYRNLNTAHQEIPDMADLFVCPEPDPAFYPCLIPGCDQYFSRTDYRGNHLRKKHLLPIPKGCWAHIWIARAENQYHFLAATEEQARAKCISCLTRGAGGWTSRV